MIVSHISAISKNRVIGIENKLPWSLPEDLKFFREKTKNHLMIMGRKTFESFPAPLTSRFHIVITRNPDFKYEHPNVKIVDSLDTALKFAATLTSQWGEEVFIIGGGEIYKQSLNLVDRIFLTVINKEFKGDTYYPEIPLSLFQLTAQIDFTEPIHFSFQTWEKKEV
jgi:dihydrofolate reductase